MRSTRLAVVVLTYNEEANLPSCLGSLQGLEGSVFVVDSGSTDRTVEIARSFGATVISHPFENYAIQRNWAQSFLPSNAPWILHLDADERLTGELVAEINKTLSGPLTGVDGFLLRKRTLFLGRWIRHGGHYPSYHLRLFRRDKGQCEERLYDQHFITSGTIKRLKNDYLDVICADLSTWTLRHRRWAELEAEQLINPDSGDEVIPDVFGNPIQRKRWFKSVYSQCPLFFRPFAYWSYRYIFRVGFLDGKEGLVFHFLQGFWFRFLVDALVFEQRKALKKGVLAVASRPARPAAALPEASLSLLRNNLPSNKTGGSLAHPQLNQATSRERKAV
jgi:glycosyltransferase involved in cell wall biosynthesis